MDFDHFLAREVPNVGLSCVRMLIALNIGPYRIAHIPLPCNRPLWFIPLRYVDAWLR